MGSFGARSASITAANNFTDPLSVRPEEGASVSVSGTWSATVHLQHRLDGTNWRDVESYTANTEKVYTAGEGCDVRIGVKTGNFTSGTVVVRLGVGLSKAT